MLSVNLTEAKLDKCKSIWIYPANMYFKVCNHSFLALVFFQKKVNTKNNEQTYVF